MRNESSFVLAILLLVTVLCGSVFAVVISVDDDGPADYSSIQAAINDSADGDVIRVEPGYYYENIYFYGKAVLVTSIDPYDPNIVGSTVINGGRMDSVVTFAWDEGPGSIIDGFRITGGRALYGSGICCWESSPTIRNNIISYNGIDEEYAVGGGIYCYKSEAVIEGNHIYQNSLGSDDMWYEPEYSDECIVSGGGIYCDESNVSIRNNSIFSNELYGSDVSGGGISCYQSTGQIEGNEIEHNYLWGGFLETALGDGFEYESPMINGAGIYCYQSEMRIENNQIEQNRRMAFFQGYWYEGFGNGGGIYCEDSPVEIVNNRIGYHWGQNALHMLFDMLDDIPGAAGVLERNGNGGGLYIAGSSATITGNEIIYNESFSRGAGIYCDSSSAIINNNEIGGNSIDQGLFGQGGGIYVSDSRGLGVYPEICGNRIMENYASGIEFDDGYPVREIGEGGGIYCDSSSPLITNNIIARNWTELYGGGIFCSEGSSPAIENNTILNNSSWNTEASVYLAQDSCPTIKNNIIVKNSGGVFWKYTSPSEFSYNCVWGNINGDYLGWAVPGEGGISEDPGFADVCALDYHLKSEYGRWDSESEVWVFDNATSMCVNAGDPSDSIRLENTPNGYRINMGAYGGTVEASKLPVGTERCTEVLAGDVNGDCMVDLDDLTVTVSGWLESVDSKLDVNTIEQKWTAKYGGGINSPIIKMITDSQDNIIVVGTVMQDYVTIKYDTKGNELWSSRYDGTGAGSDDMTDAAVDSSGNIYITGSSYNGTDGDYATVKYDPDGNELWVARYAGPDDGWDHSHAIAVDSLDNVYVTGSSYNGFNDDYVTIKYNSDGSEVWIARYDGPDDSWDRSYAIAVDSLANIYVNGESGNYCTTVKYDPDGTELWVVRDENLFALPRENSAITIDTSDNVYVIGFDANYYPDYDKNTLVKYGPDGSVIWEAKYGVASYDDKVEILLDSSEKIYVVGDSYWGGYTLVKFDPNGTEIWIAESEPESWYMMNAMTIDSSDNIYLTGVGYRNDDLIIKYDSNGNLIGTAEYECPDKWDCYSFGGGYGIAVDSMGNVYVAGERWDWDSDYEYYGLVLTTIKYSPYVCEQPLQGDVNGDCVVNFIDFAYVCKDWLDCNLYPLEYCVQ